MTYDQLLEYEADNQVEAEEEEEGPEPAAEQDEEDEEDAHFGEDKKRSFANH
jgi:hypothetical protein